MKTAKKVLALLLSVLMVFTMVSSSVAAVAETTPTEKTQLEDVENKADNIFSSISGIIDGVHNLVGGIMSVLGKECVFCDEVHGKAEADEDTQEPTEPETPPSEPEVPSEPEEPTEPETPVEPEEPKADEPTEDKIGNAFDSIGGVFDSIHNLVGNILAIFGKECPFCDEVHGKDAGETDEPDAPVEPDVPDTPDVPDVPDTPDVPEETTYTVSFDLNYEGAENNIPSQPVKKGDTVIEPEKPLREDYIFVGWYVNLDATEQFLFEEEITTSITLYANWIEEDNINLKNIFDSLRIEYTGSDYEEHVTQNVAFVYDSSENEKNVVVAWNSNNTDIVSNNGIVNRPSETDADITITATVTEGETSLSKSFSIRVIHIPNREIDDSNNYTVMDIENMNDEDVVIEYNDSETQVLAIEGKFSDIEINSSDDALDAIYDIRTILGLENPYDELENARINRSEYGNKYVFDQYYNGLKVYGRTIMLSADSEKETDLLYSSAYPSNELNSLNWTVDITEQEAKEIARNGLTEIFSEATETVIYCENEIPCIVYVVDVSGINSENQFVDITVLVDAKTGSIVSVIDNVITATGSGKNEKGTKVSFPVEFEWLDWKFFYMEDSTRNIQMYDDKFNNRVPYRICSEFNVWTDRVANSAYTNIIKVYDWYMDNLNRKSFDNNGEKIKVIVHFSKYLNNAGSNNWGLIIGDSNNAPVTYASCLDVMGHEFTHSVFRNCVSVNTGYDYNYIGAINEGYADIFGCLIDGNWILAEDRRTIRSAISPTTYSCPQEVGGSYYLDPTDQNNNPDTVAHNDSTVLSRAAYLMNSYGIPMSKLDNLWYESMSLSYDITSNFSRVRKNVLSAAKKINMSEAEVAIIKRAFDEVKIYGDRGTASFEVYGVNEGAIDNTSIQIYSGSNLVKTGTIDDGYCIFENLELGTYRVVINAEGYIPYEGTFRLKKNNEVVEKSIGLVRNGVGELNGTVVSATTGYALSNTNINIRKGYEIQNGEIVRTITADSSGNFKINLEAGYYTIEAYIEGYTTSYIGIIMVGSTCVTKRIELSPSMQSDSYRVVLSWGALPSDLDSHLFGYLENGSNYHVYYSNKNAYSNGERIANLDVDDTTSYGPETTTFVIDTKGKYEYYIDWYSGSGTWASCQGNVKVYNGDRLVYEFNAPNNNSQSGSWKVFTIENGIFKSHNTITSDIY